MVISSDESKISRIKMLALHGLSHDAWRRFSDSGYKHYYVEDAGFKYNMMDLQAAIGIHQLRRIDEYWKRREAVWNRYREAFSDLNIGLPAPVETRYPACLSLIYDPHQSRQGWNKQGQLFRSHDRTQYRRRRPLFVNTRTPLLPEKILMETERFPPCTRIR